MTDASYRDWEDSTSTWGYIIKIFYETVVLKSHKQNYVALSTC